MAKKNSKQSFTRAGDVSIDKTVLISADGRAINIMGQLIGIDLYEDMFSPFISGILYMRDAQNLVGVLPIIGEEFLQLDFSTPQLGKKAKYSGTYAVIKLNDREKTAEREIIYALHFVSVEAVVDMNTKTSRAYEGYIHEIIKDIVPGKDGLQSQKQLIVEEATNRTKFISNFWSPTKNIQYACENATNKNNSPSFIFFENKLGFNFVTLDLLYSKTEPDHYFRWDNYTAEVLPTGSSRKSLLEDYKRVLDLQSAGGFDYIKQLKSGMYGSEIIYFDLTTHQYVHTYYQPNWGEDRHLNPEPLWRNIAQRSAPKSVLLFGKQYYNNFDGYSAETANTKVQQKRESLLAQAEAFKVTINVYGSPLINAGQLVNLFIPAPAQLSAVQRKDKDMMDRVQSGNYLIGAVCHRINRKEYTCTIELIKDSYVTGIYE